MRHIARKTAQLQIRVSPIQKRQIQSAARAAGVDVSVWVLGRLLPAGQIEFLRLAKDVAQKPQGAFTLAALNDLIASLRPDNFGAVVSLDPTGPLAPFEANLVAAMVEQAALRLGLEPPTWTAAVSPLTEPYFASQLKSMRLHLLKSAPVVFKRRNLFVDATIGDRV